MKKSIILAFLFVFVSGCSTMRLEYKADVTKEDGQRVRYSYSRSYPVGGSTETLCYITGIFLGGACWFYFVMPTVDQSATAEADALAALNKSIGTKYKLQNKDVERVSWNQEEDKAMMLVADKVVPTIEEKK